MRRNTRSKKRSDASVHKNTCGCEHSSDDVVQSRSRVNRGALIKDQSGASAIEFGLIAPAFILVLLGIFGFAQYFWIESSIEEALIVAGRYSIINPTATNSQIITTAKNALPAVNPNSVTFTAQTTTTGGINYTTINGTYNFTWFSDIPALANLSISETINAPVPPGR